MLHNKFTEVDNKFASFQLFLVSPNDEERVMHRQLFNQTLGINYPNILQDASLELKYIREFYTRRYDEAKNATAKENIINEYRDLYGTFSEITVKSPNIQDAVKKVEKNMDKLANNIILNNLLNVCFALALAFATLGAGILIPIATAVIPIEPFIGITLLATGCASFILSIEKCVNCIEKLQWTDSVKKEKKHELSFFSKIDTLFSAPSKPENKPTNDEVDVNEQIIPSY